MKYLLDANIFIEAHKRYYHEKIVPSFWQWLADDEEIYTIEKVKDEIKDGNDNLYKLIEKVKMVQFNFENISTVANHVNNKYINQQEVENFLKNADPLLIAIGVNNADITIVTNEVLVGDNSQKIKIPNVCKALNVKYKIRVFDILKQKK